jgi:tetratricopeptide (TPR) repeat protein
MSRVSVVAFCLLALLIPSRVCSAQSRERAAAGEGALPNPTSAITSVHELQIPEKARAACNEGTKHLAAKDSAKSISDFQKAIKAFPGYYEAYAKLGAAELELEQWSNAESAFRKSMELSGGRYAPANFGLGLVLATVTKQFAEAEETVRAGLEIDPTNVSGRFALAWVLYSTGRLQEAEKIARDSILSAPSFPGTRLLLAQIHLQESRFSAAVEDLDGYLALGITGPLTDNARAIRAHALSKISAGPEIAATSR